MKSNFAYKQAIASEPRTVGAVVSDNSALCVSEDCRVAIVLSMMGYMNTRIAAVVSKGEVFQGLIHRSALMGGLMIDSTFDVGSRIDVSDACKLRAGDVMVTAPCFLPSELSVEDALEIMEETGFATLPVLGDNARFIGIAHKKVLEASLDGDLGQVGFHHLMDIRNATRGTAS